MDNKLIGTIMAVVVGVILLGSLLSVTISDYSTSTLTYTNEGTPFKAVDENEHTIVIKTVDETASVTVDGTEVDNPQFLFDNSATIVYGSEGFIRLANNGSIRVFTEESNTVRYSSLGDLTITISGDDVTVTGGNANDVNATIKPMAYISNEGEYTQTLNPVIDDETVLIGGATTISGSSYFSLVAYGSLDDLTVTLTKASYSDITFVNYNVDSTPTGKGDLVKVNAVDFTVNNGTTDLVGHYSFFLVPKEITYDNPDYLGSEYVGLLGAIMVIFVAGLFVVAVSTIFRNRY